MGELARARTSNKSSLFVVVPNEISRYLAVNFHFTFGVARTCFMQSRVKLESSILHLFRKLCSLGEIHTTIRVIAHVIFMLKIKCRILGTGAKVDGYRLSLETIGIPDHEHVRFRYVPPTFRG
jgi:hypothetical protein